MCHSLDSPSSHRSVDLGHRQVSLTMPPQTNARGLAQSNSSATEETFLKLIDSELTKVEKFTLERVTELRTKIREVEQMPMEKDGASNREAISEKADEIAQ